ncbi:MAG: beta-lactamase [Rheinheimera sp.]|nr:MAG: beta-lactamase [Rheinheimera sp.]
MHPVKFTQALTLALPVLLSAPALAQHAAIQTEAALQSAVQHEVTQLMQQQQIPGIAVAVLWQGKTFFYSFGQADVAAKTAVTPDTLFEIGSVSKTFAGVIGAMALERGDMKLTDPVAKHWPALTAKPWQHIKMQQLATYTAGGLPLFMPDSVTDKTSLLNYLQQWQPEFAPGTQRVYANSSIGLFAHLAVAAGGSSYGEVFQQLTSALKMPNTYLQVPAAAQAQYAWGYNEGKPVRIGSGVLLDEAGGVKASVRDLATWLNANLQPEQVQDPLLRAGIAKAQQRYAKSKQMYQGLGWEMLDYPVTVAALTAMTAPEFVAGTAATVLAPPAPAVANSWIHKTGATGGFGAYAAFIPSRQVGIVLLSNKRYPNALRVELAHKVLENLK